MMLRTQRVGQQRERVANRLLGLRLLGLYLLLMESYQSDIAEDEHPHGRRILISLTQIDKTTDFLHGKIAALNTQLGALIDREMAHGRDDAVVVILHSHISNGILRTALIEEVTIPRQHEAIALVVGRICLQVEL